MKISILPTWCSEMILDIIHRPLLLPVTIRSWPWIPEILWRIWTSKERRWMVLKLQFKTMSMSPLLRDFGPPQREQKVIISSGNQAATRENREHIFKHHRRFLESDQQFPRPWHAIQYKSRNLLKAKDWENSSGELVHRLDVAGINFDLFK